MYAEENRPTSACKNNNTLFHAEVGCLLILCMNVTHQTVNMLDLQIGAHAIIAYLTDVKMKIMIDFLSKFLTISGREGI